MQRRRDTEERAANVVRIGPRHENVKPFYVTIRIGRFVDGAEVIGDSNFMRVTIRNGPRYGPEFANSEDADERDGERNGKLPASRSTLTGEHFQLPRIYGSETGCPRPAPKLQDCSTKCLDAWGGGKVVSIRGRRMIGARRVTCAKRLDKLRS